MQLPLYVYNLIAYPFQGQHPHSCMSDNVKIAHQVQFTLVKSHRQLIFGMQLNFCKYTPTHFMALPHSNKLLKEVRHILNNGHLKVETEIIVSISASPIGRSVIQKITSVETIEMSVILFISYIIINTTRPLNCLIFQSITTKDSPSLIMEISGNKIKGKIIKLSINILCLHKFNDFITMK